ncbi:hypothetical protein Tco_0299284 [Tanacetum coccineum]
MIPSPPLLPPPTHRYINPEADMMPRKRARFAAPSHRYGFVAALEANKRVTDLAIGYRRDSHIMYVRHQKVYDDLTLLRARIASLKRERGYFHGRAITAEQESTYTQDT